MLRVRVRTAPHGVERGSRRTTWRDRRDRTSGSVSSARVDAERSTLARAVRAPAPARPAGGLVRRRDVRAHARRARRGVRGQGRLHARLRRRSAGAVPQGRDVPPHGRPGRARSASARTRPGTCPRRRSESCSAMTGAIAGYTIGNDVSSRDIEGANPLYLPQAKVYAGACAIGPAVLVAGAERAVRDPAADPRRGRRRALRGRDVDRAHAALVRGARRLAPPRQPGPAGQRPADRHRHRAARRLHAPARPPSSRSTCPASARSTNHVALAAEPPSKGAAHDRDPHRRARPQLRRRRVARQRHRRDVREAQPVAAVRGDRRLPGLRRRRRARRGRGCARGVPGLVALPAARAAAFFSRPPTRSRRRAEQIAQDMTAEMGKPLREARMEAAARGDDPPLRGRRGVAPGRRGVRALGREPAAVHRAAPARRRRPDHAVELPHRDPRLEARAGADLRQHGRAQARLRGAAHRAARGRVLRRSGAAGRRAERPHRRRARRSAPSSSRNRARPRDLVHRLGAGRPRACATRRPRATAASSSSSAGTTR